MTNNAQYREFDAPLCQAEADKRLGAFTAAVRALRIEMKIPDYIIVARLSMPDTDRYVIDGCGAPDSMESMAARGLSQFAAERAKRIERRVVDEEPKP